MTACNRSGNFDAVVTVADIVEHRFQENNAEILITFATSDNQKGKIYLDLSEDSIQQGPHQGEKNYIRTRNSLLELGVDISSMSNIRKLNGMTIPVYGKPDKKGVLRFYLSSEREDKIMDPRKAKAHLERLFGGAAPMKDQPAKPAIKSNPLVESKSEDEGDDIAI